MSMWIFIDKLPNMKQLDKRKGECNMFRWEIPIQTWELSIIEIPDIPAPNWDNLKHVKNVHDILKDKSIFEWSKRVVGINYQITHSSSEVIIIEYDQICDLIRSKLPHLIKPTSSWKIDIFVVLESQEKVEDPLFGTGEYVYLHPYGVVLVNTELKLSRIVPMKILSKITKHFEVNSLRKHIGDGQYLVVSDNFVSEMTFDKLYALMMTT